MNGKINKIIICEVEKYLIVVLIILASKTVFFGLVNASYTYILLFTVLLLDAFFSKKILRFNKGNLCVLLALGVLAVIQAGRHVQELSSSYLSTMMISYLPFLFSFLAVQVLSCEDYMSRYTDVMLVISCISLVCFSIAVLWPNLAWVISNPVSFNNNMYNISWFYTWGWGIHIFARNSGPFWEPGAFQGFLLLSVLFTIFCTERIKFRRAKVILFLVTILTTGSTTGYILLMIVLVCFYEKFKAVFVTGKNLRNQKLIRIGVAILIIGAIMTVLLSGNLADKFSSSNESAITRWRDVSSSVSMVFDYPLVGFGFSTERITRASQLGVENDSVGLWSLLYTCGIPFGLYYLCRQFAGIRRMLGINQFQSVVLLLILLVIHMTEAVWWLPVYTMFLFTMKSNQRMSRVNQ